MAFLQTLAKSTVVFLFLMLPLWWSLTRVVVTISSRWMPSSFFRFEREKEAHMELAVVFANLFEAALISAVALPGYLSVTNGGSGIFSRKGTYNRFVWLSLCPWLLAFGRGWLINMRDFYWNVPQALEAINFKVFTFLYLSGLFVQALLWSEVLQIAQQGWIRMRNASIVEYDGLPAKRKLFEM